MYAQEVCGLHVSFASIMDGREHSDFSDGPKTIHHCDNLKDIGFAVTPDEKTIHICIGTKHDL